MSTVGAIRKGGSWLLEDEQARVAVVAAKGRVAHDHVKARAGERVGDTGVAE